MAIAPITGILKKKIIVDVSIGLGIGAVAGSYWWWGFHKGKVQKREDYYDALAKQQQEQDE